MHASLAVKFLNVRHDDTEFDVLAELTVAANAAQTYDAGGIDFAGWRDVTGYPELAAEPYHAVVSVVSGVGDFETPRVSYKADSKGTDKLTFRKNATNGEFANNTPMGTIAGARPIVLRARLQAKRNLADVGVKRAGNMVR